MSSKRKKAPLSVKISESATPKEQAGSDGRQVQLSWEGVKAVQKKIERCLELYMTQVCVPMCVLVLVCVAMCVCVWGGSLCYGGEELVGFSHVCAS